MSRRYWISSLTASVVLMAGLVLVGVTLQAGGFAGRDEAAPGRQLCRSCAIFGDVAHTVSRALDSDSARAFHSGLDPWRGTCEDERRQCSAMFAPMGPGGLCPALRNDWKALEAQLTARLRTLKDLAATCKALSCPALDCEAMAAARGATERAGQSLRIVSLLGVPAYRSEAKTYALAAALLSEGRSALARLTASLAPDVLDFAGEWSFWQRFAAQLDTAGDDLFAHGDLSETGRQAFEALARGARKMALALEDLGASEGLEAHWRALGAAYGAFLVASARVDEIIAHAVSPAPREACGLTVSDGARRVEGLLQQAAGGLSACAARAACAPQMPSSPPHLPIFSEPAPVLKTLAASLNALDEAAAALNLTPGAPAYLSADLPEYRPREPVVLDLKGEGNRCLAQGFGVTFEAAGGAQAPLLREEYPGTNEMRLFLAAPQTPGRYVASAYALGNAPDERGLPLAQAPFTVVPQSSAKGCAGFAGVWTTDFGTLTAVVRGTQLRGTYQREGAARPGILIGTVKGRDMRGRWSSDLGAGGAHLVLSPKGGQFSGTWGETPELDDGAGLWRGRCAAEGD